MLYLRKNVENPFVIVLFSSGNILKDDITCIVVRLNSLE